MNSDKFDTKIAEARELIKNNAKEWAPRYNEYAKKIIENIPKIKKRKKLFNEWEPLYIYMNVTEATKDTSSTFNLRFNGQSVADLKFNGGKIILNVGRRDQKSNKTYFGVDLQKCSEFHWRSPEAEQFRKFFSTCTRYGRSLEHTLESKLLSELEKNSKINKDEFLHNIQPVKIAKTICRFQMPTPLKASGNAGLEYSGEKGGGIDILARIGTGRGTSLCIMELKKEAKSPDTVMSQVLAYAVFIQELLDSESGPAWSKIFGFKKSLNKSALTVCSVMPSSKMQQVFHEKIDIPTELGLLKLRYMNIHKDWNKIFKILNTNILQ